MNTTTFCNVLLHINDDIIHTYVTLWQNHVIH